MARYLCGYSVDVAYTPKSIFIPWAEFKDYCIRLVTPRPRVNRICLAVIIFLLAGFWLSNIVFAVLRSMNSSWVDISRFICYIGSAVPIIGMNIFVSLAIDELICDIREQTTVITNSGVPSHPYILVNNGVAPYPTILRKDPVNFQCIIKSWIGAWIVASSLWSLSYFIYWYTNVLGLASTETLEWIGPVIISVVLLCSCAWANVEADKLQRAFEKQLIANGGTNVIDRHRVQLWLRCQPFHITFGGYAPKYTALLFLAPQVIVVIVKFLIGT